MKVKYVRCSTEKGQRTDRQTMNAKNFDLVYEEFCSGSVQMLQRPVGRKLLADIEDGKVTEVWVEAIDRLGRNTVDCLNTLQVCDEANVMVVIENMSLRSRNADGSKNHIFSLISGIMATLAEQERKSIAERCTAGRMAAIARGQKFGRRVGERETMAKFLKKEKVQAVIKTIRRKPTLTVREVSAINGVSLSLVCKVRKAIAV